MKTLIVRPLLLLGLLLCPIAWADSPARAERPDGAAIASGHALATQAGIDILAQGGNAFDAAVAVSSTLAVVEPISSGLGGGGFFLLHDAATGKDVMLDARETAPAAATPQAFLDKTSKQAPGALADASGFTVAFEKGGVTYYRARFGGFDTKTAAWKACDALKKKKIQCYAVQQ